MTWLLCKLFGHKRWEYKVLHENKSIKFPTALRDNKGRAMSWPTCTTCEKRIFVEIPE